MANEIIVAGGAEMFMPVMDVKQAVARRGALVGFVQGIMVKGADYGAVPGTDKPTLLKPGAEKLTTFFGLAPVFVSERIVEEFGDDGREPLFFYRYRCELYRAGTLVGSGIGSCNSRESKYRYRNAARVCPHCGKPAIIKGQEQYGGGWVCFKKKDGCGAKFADNDPAIVNQQMGKVPNPDVADLVNTIDKMAQKRALIAAVLIAVNASEFFTQDVEDMVIDAEYTVASAERKESAAKSNPAPTATVTTTGNGGAGNGSGNGHKPTAAALKAFHATGSRLYGQDWDGKRHEIIKAYTKGRTESSGGITADECAYLTERMEAKLQAQLDAIAVDAVPELNPDAAEIPA